jgi:GNAT superfamily N-acetyltransferase
MQYNRRDMMVRFVRLIAEKREDLWTGQQDFSRLFGQSGTVPRLGAPYGPLDHMRYIKEKRGEKIVALDGETGQLVGWIGLFPDKDEGGPLFRLAGIEVHADHRGRGIGSGLMAEAEKYLRERHAARLRFGTSPLLTQNAGLCITKFGTRYRWKEGVRSPDGRPWPYVVCELDFDDPLPRPLGLRDEQAREKSVLDWDGMRPVPKKTVVYAGTLFVVLPPLTGSLVAEAVAGVPLFLETLSAVFQELHVHGCAFAWFDRVPPVEGAAPLYYYAMSGLMGV